MSKEVSELIDLMVDENKSAEEALETLVTGQVSGFDEKGNMSKKEFLAFLAKKKNGKNDKNGNGNGNNNNNNSSHKKDKDESEDGDGNDVEEGEHNTSVTTMGGGQASGSTVIDSETHPGKNPGKGSDKLQQAHAKIISKNNANKAEMKSPGFKVEPKA